MRRHPLYEAALERGPVEVTWLDSMAAAGWTPWSTLEDVVDRDGEVETLTIRSAGYVLADDDVRLTLVASVGAESGCDVMTIPRAAVLGIVPLRGLDGS